MNFARYLRMDVECAARGILISSGAFACAIALTVTALWLTAAAQQIDWTTFTLGDNLSGVFAGMKQLESLKFTARSKLPAGWMLVFSLAAYATLTYPYRNLMGFGTQALIAGGDRRAWWMAKCVLVAAHACLLCAVALDIVAIMTACAGGTVSLDMTGLSLTSLDVDIQQLREPPWEVAPSFATIPATLITLCLIQLVLSLILRPVLGYAATVTILIASLFIPNPFLLGNHLMMARSNCLFFNGFDTTGGLAWCATLCACSMIVGGLLFCRMDIMDKEFDA